MTTYKVLSVDWDYFIDASENTRENMFPDSPNDNNSRTLQDAIWMFLYAGNEELEKIGIKSNEMSVVMRAISRSIENGILDGKFYLLNSHRHIYKFLMEIADEEPDCEFEIYNIDHHHDMFAINEKQPINPHCGDWAHLLMAKLKDRVSYSWIPNKDSAMQSGSAYYKKVLVKTLDEIENLEFDIIYICKSPEWSPPHLDWGFIGAFLSMAKEANALTDKDAWENRWTDEMKSLILDSREKLRKLHENMVNSRGQSIDSGSMGGP
jgi:hypothetical protein